MLPIEPDKVLRGAEGQVGMVLVLGWDFEGELYAAASEGNEEALVYLLERFKHDLFSGAFRSGNAVPVVDR